MPKTYYLAHIESKFLVWENKHIYFAKNSSDVKRFCLASMQFGSMQNNIGSYRISTWKNNNSISSFSFRYFGWIKYELWCFGSENYCNEFFIIHELAVEWAFFPHFLRMLYWFLAEKKWMIFMRNTASIQVLWTNGNALAGE